MRTLIVVLFVLTSSQSFARIGSNVLSYSDFLRLGRSERAEYIDTLREAAIQSEKAVASLKHTAHDISFHSVLTEAWFENAWAATGDSCYYAGYVSKRNARDICESPKDLAEKAWTVTVGGQTKTQKLCVGSGQVLCNPLLFGFGTDGNGICSSRGSRPTNECEQKYQKMPNYKAYQVADQLVANNMKAEFDAHATQTSNYCASDKSAAQSSICKMMARKTDYMRAKIAASQQRTTAPRVAQAPAGSRGLHRATADSPQGPAQIPQQQPSPQTPQRNIANFSAPETSPSLNQPPAHGNPENVPPKNPEKAPLARPLKPAQPPKTADGGANPYDSNDRDLQALRKKGVLTKDLGKELAFSTETFSDNKGTWKIRILKSKSGSETPVFYLPHDNENLALETAVRYLKEHGQGKIVFLDCDDQRLCNGTDPNRHFCSSDGGGKYADKIFSFFPGSQPVIGLHTNENGFGDGRGGMSAKNDKIGGANGHVDYRSGDEDDVVIHNGPASLTGLNKDLHRLLVKDGINEVYESGNDDCSMSFEATRRGRFFYNVETEERSTPGAYKTQLATLDTLIKSNLGFSGSGQQGRMIGMRTPAAQ